MLSKIRYFILIISFLIFIVVVFRLVNPPNKIFSSHLSSGEDYLHNSNNQAKSLNPILNETQKQDTIISSVPDLNRKKTINSSSKKLSKLNRKNNVDIDSNKFLTVDQFTTNEEIAHNYLESNDITLVPKSSLKMIFVHKDSRLFEGEIKMYLVNEEIPKLIGTFPVLQGELLYTNFTYWGQPLEFRTPYSDGARKVIYQKDKAELQEEMIVLHPLAQAQVKVFDTENKPVSGATVSIYFSDFITGHDLDREPPSEFWEITGTEGIVNFNLTEGKYLFHISHADYALSETLVEIPSSGQKIIVIKLLPRKLLQGLVITQANDISPSGLIVTIKSKDNQISQKTSTDSNGNFSFSNLKAGVYDIIINISEGFDIGQSGIIIQDDEEISHVTISIPPLITISFKFTSGNSPISNGSVSLSHETLGQNMIENQYCIFQLKTNNEGYINTKIIPGDFTLVLSKPLFRTAITINPQDNGKVIEFNLGQYLIHVLVIEKESQIPVQNVAVTLIPNYNDELYFYQYLTDQDGKVTFQVSNEGTYKLSVDGGNEFQKYEGESIELKQSVPEPQYTVKLSRIVPPSGTLVVKFIDERTGYLIGEKIRYYYILYPDTNQQVTSIKVENLENGILIVTGLQPGNYRLFLLSPHYKSEKIKILIQENTGQLITVKGKLSAAYRIIIKNLPSNLNIVQPFIVTFYDPLNHDLYRDAYWTWIDKDIGPLLPAYYFYEFEIPELGQFTGIVDLVEGKTSPIEVDIK